MYQQSIPSFGGTTITTNYIFNSSPKPTAHITKGRGRLKAYGNKVYLKNGSNFEIELFNPKSISVLAKIWINGSQISDAGIILKPGQRVYLERFIDVSKKFVFETYEVEANSAEAMAAIANNGKVVVYFHDEADVRIRTSWPQNWNYTNAGGLKTTTDLNYVNYCANVGSVTNGSSSSFSTLTSSQVNSSTVQETGRVEKGESSGQELVNGSGSFEFFSCATSEWQILPEGKKPVEAGEIRSYCTNCGTRQKKATWKFCPNCGTPVTA